MLNYYSTTCEVLLLLCLGAIVYVYVGYPLLLCIIALFHQRKRFQPGPEPLVSILIAAYNEENSIAEKIQQTLDLDYPEDKIEVLILSDCSTDRTDAIVRGFGDARVRLLRMPVRRGKTHAQNIGMKAAKGEIVVFSDATTVYHPQALRYLICNYQDPTVGAVAGRNQYFDEKGTSPMGLGTVAFWNYETLIKTLQSRISTVSGCSGCIYSIRKNVYTDLADDVISDLVQPLWVIQKGFRVVFENRAIAYEKTTYSVPEEFAMRVRVVTRAMRGLLSVPDLFNPMKYGWVTFQLISHKVLRWMVPFFLMGALGLTAMLTFVEPARYFLWAQTGFYGLAFFARAFPVHRRWKLIGIPLYFCVLNTAALVSVFEVLRGRKYVVWETVRKTAA